VEGDRGSNAFLDLALGGAGRHATRQVGHVGGVVVVGPFDDDGIPSTHGRPRFRGAACFGIGFSVPGGRRLAFNVLVSSVDCAVVDLRVLDATGHQVQALGHAGGHEAWRHRRGRTAPGRRRVVDDPLLVAAVTLERAFPLQVPRAEAI